MGVLRPGPARASAAILGLAALAACGVVQPAAQPPAPIGAARVPSAYSIPLSATQTAPRTTRPFSLLGMVWDDHHAPLDATVRVRTRDAAAGRWSPWRTLRADEDDQPDPAPGRTLLKGYTTPLWVGSSNGVQVTIRPKSGGNKLPAGLRLALVDPGNPVEQPPIPGGPPSWLLLLPAGPVTPRGASPSSTPYLPPRPSIVTRAGWHADETLHHKLPVYADAVRVVFIHHTDQPNGYACSEVPQMIRGIYEYHVGELGWDDLGYNFLVDRCGTIYEGRAGGVDRPVVGGHTQGFNIGSAGIAAIGTFGPGQPVPQPMIDAIARLAAWKLGLYGESPTGRRVMYSNDGASRFPKGRPVTLDAISGHRDADWTVCPGDSLYAALPAIRAEAARRSRRP